ncbi:5542_t:CDS:2 [Funneliformis caledonium]|uniref:5542_t:CDS:1 n=1 Tax=Funneliformis caledonium TaxID=1117310 RepID=A0A9N9I1D2_9GLOM|nr:5542_t:CDS:2 [Funneliformis caledonium]
MMDKNGKSKNFLNKQKGSSHKGISNVDIPSNLLIPCVQIPEVNDNAILAANKNVTSKASNSSKVATVIDLSEALISFKAATVIDLEIT